MVKTRISLTIDPDILKRMDKLSKKSRSSFIEKAIEEKLNNSKEAKE